MGEKQQFTPNKPCEASKLVYFRHRIEDDAI